ncbi:hypothetical protein ABKA04_005481 [Annulohypoxylon sp. FPYF3050]
MINVVLALALRTSRPGEIAPIGSTEIYLNNAQSVLTQAIMCETTLMNIQILLGIAILFWTADDLRPALVLIATAMRLSHQLGFHSRKCSEHLGQTAALQHNRLDSEIELDLPPLDAEDDHTGFVFAPDGHAKLNFFRARVELAMIQGKVYECAYSASAQKFTSEERSQKARQIFGMLDEWTLKIPPVFTNRIFEGHHGIIALDMDLMRAGMLYLEDMVKQTDRKMLQNTWDSIMRLRSYADLIAHSSHPPTWPNTNRLDGDPQSNVVEFLESHHTVDKASALHFDENWTPSDTGTWEIDQV